MECPEITSFLMSNIYFREDIIYLLYSPIRPVQNFKALWKYLLVFKNSFQITSTFMNLRCVCVWGGVGMCVISCVRLFVTPWTTAWQAPLSMRFSRQSRQKYWSGLPFPPLGDLPDPGIEPESPACVSCISRQILYH